MESKDFTGTVRGAAIDGLLGATLLVAIALALIGILPPAYAAVAWGIVALTVAVYIAGPWSGGQVNPGVSISMWLNGTMSFLMFVLYSLFQIAGATGAMFASLGFEASAATQYIPKTASGASRLDGMGHEAFGVFLLCIFIRFLPNSALRCLFIGAILTVDILSFSKGGGSFNPAVALAPFLLARTTEGLVQVLIVNVCGSLLGGAVAGGLSRLLVGKPT